MLIGGATEQLFCVFCFFCVLGVGGGNLLGCTVAHDGMEEPVAAVRQRRLGRRGKDGLQRRRRTLEALQRGALLGVGGLVWYVWVHQSGRHVWPLEVQDRDESNLMLEELLKCGSFEKGT